MNIVNLTPHSINIYTEADVEASGATYTVVAGCEPATTYPSAGVARAAQLDGQQHTINFNGVEIPVFNPVQYGEPQNLPEPQEGVFLVVSALTAQAAARHGRTTSDLLLVHRAVRDDQGRIVGCLGFCRV